jgi:hypothetical protein
MGVCRLRVSISLDSYGIVSIVVGELDSGQQVATDLYPMATA